VVISIGNNRAGGRGLSEPSKFIPKPDYTFEADIAMPHKNNLVPKSNVGGQNAKPKDGGVGGNNAPGNNGGNAGGNNGNISISVGGAGGGNGAGYASPVAASRKNSNMEGQHTAAKTSNADAEKVSKTRFKIADEDRIHIETSLAFPKSRGMINARTTEVLNFTFTPQIRGWHEFVVRLIPITNPGGQENIHDTYGSPTGIKHLTHGRNELGPNASVR
jgi:hypothetical protein